MSKWDNCWVLTNELRFIVRDGKKVLQQKWEKHYISEPGMLFERPTEWRDVPMEAELVGEKG